MAAGSTQPFEWTPVETITVSIQIPVELKALLDEQIETIAAEGHGQVSLDDEINNAIEHYLKVCANARRHRELYQEAICRFCGLEIYLNPDVGWYHFQNRVRGCWAASWTAATGKNDELKGRWMAEPPLQPRGKKSAGHTETTLNRN